MAISKTPPLRPGSRAYQVFTPADGAAGIFKLAARACSSLEFWFLSKFGGLEPSNKSIVHKDTNVTIDLLVFILSSFMTIDPKHN
jgi:hypothetical protein